MRQDRGEVSVTIARREFRKWLRESAEGKAVEKAVEKLLGISRDWDVNRPFAYQSSPLESLDEGIGNSMTTTTTPRSALRCLAYHLTEAQKKEESQWITPEARKGMAQWQLHECLEGLPDGAEL